jgi:hypothetical protein
MNTATNVKPEGFSPAMRTLIFGLVVAVVLALPLTVEAAGGYYAVYNPCGWLAPFLRCNVYGSCWCSMW